MDDSIHASLEMFVHVDHSETLTSPGTKSPPHTIAAIFIFSVLID